MSKVKGQIDDVKGVMVANIEKVSTIHGYLNQGNNPFCYGEGYRVVVGIVFVWYLSRHPIFVFIIFFFLLFVVGISPW